MANDSPESQPKETWGSGEAYEGYVGRWSRRVAAEFIPWLGVPASARWLDVGCGTGALSAAILDAAAPRRVIGADSSAGFIAAARRGISDERAAFQVGAAQALPLRPAAFDAAVSGFVLNFVPRPVQMLAEMARVTRPGGVVAVYVWDYAERMQFMRHFWNAAAALDPPAGALDEGRRFAVCAPGPLAELFAEVGLSAVRVRPIDLWTVFKDFDDFWLPFLGGTGSAPGYLKTLNDEMRAALRERLRRSLPAAVDGSIPLMARAWAVSGVG